jgi:hypothetical protein
MKKLLYIAATLFTFHTASAQVLNVPEVIQEQDQWCWSGCSKCILNYYNFTINQCDIADYARSVITWHSFGTTPCCISAASGCNYWNYNYGYAGSIQDILRHFDGITNHGTSALTQAQMVTDVSHYHPFVLHWSWVGGGGHFVVGHGVDSAGMIHYMNPWFGEGLHICTYAWMQTDGSHIYDATNVIDTCPVAVTAGTITGTALVTAGHTTTLANTTIGGTWSCSNAHATVSPMGIVSGMTVGFDTIRYVVNTPCGAATTTKVVQVKSAAGIGSSPVSSTDMELYPNPTEGSFILQVAALTTEPLHIVVTNIVGATVATYDGSTNSPVQLHLDQPEGIYLVSASTTQGKYEGKIVVRH